MNLKPLNDRIVVKRVETADDPDALIVKPDSAKDKPQEGIVLAVGPGRESLGRASSDQRFPMTLKVGEHVLFGKYVGAETEVDGETLLIMREDDVFAVIERQAKSAKS